MKIISKFKQDLIDLNYKVTEEEFYFQLSAVPPKSVKGNSFLVGEAGGFSPITKQLIYDCYIEHQNQYYHGGRMSIQDFNKHF